MTILNISTNATSNTINKENRFKLNYSYNLNPVSVMKRFDLCISNFDNITIESHKIKLVMSNNFVYKPKEKILFGYGLRTIVLQKKIIEENEPLIGDYLKQLEENEEKRKKEERKKYNYYYVIEKPKIDILKVLENPLINVRTDSKRWIYDNEYRIIYKKLFPNLKYGLSRDGTTKEELMEQVKFMENNKLDKVIKPKIKLTKNYLWDEIKKLHKELYPNKPHKIRKRDKKEVLIDRYNTLIKEKILNI